MQRGAAPPYLLALVALAADDAALAEVAAEVARDVAKGAAPDDAGIAAARDAVGWLLDVLRAGPVPAEDQLRALREGAAAEARAGRSLQPVLDRTLSAGWVVWDRVTAGGGAGLAADGLRALGDALLRTGDAAAATIAEGHAAAEREIATRSASALRELLDELLDLPAGDEPGRARLARRTGELAIPVDRPLEVVVVDAGRDLEDRDPVVAAVARRLTPGLAPAVGDPRSLGGQVPAPVVAATHGRLVILVPRTPRPPDVRAALEALEVPGWWATSATADGLLAASAALREATAALAVARRSVPPGRVVPAASLALERALLAEPDLLRAAVDRELAPLVEAPRAGGLVDTLEAYLAERENVRAAARRLGVAPRTVAYRLERVERLLGGKLDAERRLRLATALFARRLLEDAPGAATAVSGPARAPRRAAAGRPR